MLWPRIVEHGTYMPGVCKKIEEEHQKILQSKRKSAAMLLSHLTAEVALKKAKIGPSGRFTVRRSDVEKEQYGSSPESIKTIAAFLEDHDDSASFEESLAQWAASIGYTATRKDTPGHWNVDRWWVPATWRVTMTPKPTP